jgi:hypothetical protein
MKYFVRIFVFSLIFAGAVTARPTPKAVAATRTVNVNHVAFASGPTPLCDPNDPTCVPFE